MQVVELMKPTSIEYHSTKNCKRFGSHDAF